MKKVLLVGLVIAFFVPLCIFASGAQEQTKSTVGPIVINHWYWVPTADEPRYKEMIDEFNRTHSDIQVVWENVPHNEARTKLISAFVVGEGPDTFALQEGWSGEFNSMGMLAPLDDYIETWEKRDEVFPNLYEVATFDGVLKGLPWKMLIGYMYYRADWFEDEGVAVPETIDELIQAAIKLTGKYTNEDGVLTDRYGYGLRGGSGGGNTYFVWCQTYGAEIFDENGKVVFNSPVAVEATKKYIGLHRDLKVVPPSVLGDGFAQIIGAFKSGKTAILQHHIGTSVEISGALGDKAGVMRIPAGIDGNRWTEAGHIFHAISSNSKKKEAAFKFISWMSEDWAVEHQSKYLGSIPITRNVAAMPYFTENRFYKVSTESIPFTGTWPTTASWGNVSSSETVTLLQRALMGEITPEQVVQRIAELLEKK
jgi:multiple sugar transport system substrate-binding protein